MCLLPVSNRKKAAATSRRVYAIGDPVGAGIVESLAHLGKNVTGLSDAANIQGHRLQLLREIARLSPLIPRE
jgi:ABC-type uncharacterized transport system substrate-binding protein